MDDLFIWKNDAGSDDYHDEEYSKYISIADGMISAYSCEIALISYRFDYFWIVITDGA